MSSCCAPRRSEPATSAPERPIASRVGATAAEDRSRVRDIDLIALPGGPFLMGSADRDVNLADGEGPVRQVVVSPFRIGATQVTNDQFRLFVEETGYRTGAEKYGWSFVFAGFLPGRLRKNAKRPSQTPWWCGVDGATWSAPFGPGSSLHGLGEHPVVHTDHEDALAYCEWAGLRLPTEAEWEYAARGGLDGARYPWGDELRPGGEYRCNIWHGSFPVKNTREDGYAGSCPVRTFAPNAFGLFGTSGNVWEWCADWWSVEHASDGAVDPSGPTAGGAGRVMRGGSYLCHDSYCNRYRVSARTQNDPGSSSGNIGFRCAADAQ